MVKLVRPLAFEEATAGDSRSQNVSPVEIPGTPEREPGERLRVLAIDDDKDLLASIAESLNPLLFEVRTTNSADAFYAELHKVAPDVVILDLAMPAHDGMDILKGLRDRAFAGGVVVMSGRDGHMLETVRRVGASYRLRLTGLLQKPFQPKQLVSLLLRNEGEGAGDEAGMAVALSERRIRPYFQPKVDLRTGSIVGAEALSRWYHPQRGLLLPHTYLDGKRASKNSLHDFTIFERVTEFCGKLNTMGQRMKIAVNFAAEIVLCNEFMDVVSDAHRRHGVDPDQLIIELTEHEAAENFTELAERLLKLRLYGIELSIDDFGTGHSSLSRLHLLPASEIKIDRSFISGLAESAENMAIVRSIVQLAHAFHCKVVAEGVESPEALEQLQDAGCDSAQGFLFSPAVNESTFIALIRDNPFVLGTEKR